MKRLFAFLLALVLFAGYIPVTAVHVHAEEAEDVTVEVEEIPTEPGEITEPEEETEPEEITEPEVTEPEFSVTEHTLTPKTELPGSDALFEGYATQLFYGNSTSLFGNAAGEQLSGNAKVLYDALKPVIKQLASGERTSAVIGVGKTVSIEEETYTADVSATFSGGSLTKEELSRVYSALLADLPYEMYWYDKTTGCSTQQIGSADNLVHVQASFTVAANYRGANDHTVDAAPAAAAITAAENAKALISQHKSKTDYKKLLAYKDAICGLVSYDNNAAKNGDFASDNDPWQLIHVFDEDSSTNVVCEGYSKAFMYLCDMSDFSGDVSCYTVTGLMGTGAHMWNIVTLEDENFLADVTNSDAGTVGSDGSLFLVGTAGSIADGYTFGSYTYTYDSATKSLWGSGSSSILALAEENYDPIPMEGKGWVISDEGVLTVTGNMENYAYNAYAPWYEARSRINKVVIGEDVTFIGHYAFYDCDNLTEVQLHDGITAIGGYAFYSCGKLQSVQLPAGVSSIGDHAFAYCAKLESVNIPEGVQKIQGYTFNSCAALTQIKIPNSVTEIGEFSFQDSGLTALTLPENLTTIGQSAFRNTKITTLTVPDSVTTVGLDAFWYCNSLTSVKLGKGVTWVRNGAFGSCSSLSSVTFTGDAPTIDSIAFKSTVATVYYPHDAEGWASMLTNYGGTLNWRMGSSAETLSQGICGSSTVSWSVSADGVLFLSGAGAMPDYSYSSGKTTAPWSGYYLTIQKVVVEKGITYIGDYAFYGCEKLKEFYFAGDYPSFGTNAMKGVSAKAQYLPGNATWDPDVLTGFGGSLTWRPKGTNNEYIACSPASSGGNYWQISYDGELWVSNDYAFADLNSYGGAPWYPYRKHIKTLKLEDGVYRIGNLSFYELPKLQKADLGNVTQIGSYAFEYCDALTSVDMGSYVNSIGKCAFYGCTALEEVYIPYVPNLQVSDYAFGNCTGLLRATIPGAVTLGTEVFEFCSKLNTIYIGTNDSLSGFNADANAFKYVTATVYYPVGSCSYTSKRASYGGTLTWVESKNGMCGSGVTWNYNATTKELTIKGNGKSSYGFATGSRTPWGAFTDEIETVTVMNGVTGIGPYSFEFCEKLTSISLPSSLKDLNASAFNDCVSLNNLLLPAGLESFSRYEFNRCESLTDIYYLGTQESWEKIENSSKVVSYQSVETIHKLQEVPTTATCTASGKQAYYAFDDTSVYGSKYTENGTVINSLQTVPALGHDYAETVVAPTCTEDGYTLHTCGRCGDEKTDSVVGKLGHTGGMATCKDLAICGRCEKTYGELDPSNHTGGTELRGKVDPTCTEEGYTGDLYCLGCTEKLETGKTDKELGHTGGTATCKDLAICGRCGKTYGELDPSNHTGGTELRDKVDPTCTEEGYTGDTYCLGCGDLLSAGSAVKENGHSYSKKVTAPTCTKKGYTTYTCDCGDSYVSDYTPVTKHTYTKKVTAPTYTKQGYTTYTCKCGHSYKSNYTKAKGLPAPSTKAAMDTATGKPKVSWAAVKEASKYEVYRAASKTGTYTKLGTTTKTSHVDTSAAMGKTYYYKVKAICNADSKLNSGFSSVVSATAKCGQPKVTLSKNSKGYPVLKWGKVEGAKKYQVYYATSENGTYKKLTTTSKLTYTHTKAAAGKEYFYKVRAYGKSTSTAGAYSEPLRAVKQLATPKLTVTTKQDLGQNTLKWKKITGATSYVLQCSVNGGSYKTIATTSKLTFTHTGLVGGNSYTYRLRAKSAVSDAASAYSAVKTVNLKCAKTAIASIKLNAKQKPVITWQKVAGAVKYQVYYATAKSGKYKLVGTITGTSFTHSAAPTAKVCYYKIKAVDKNGALSNYSAYKSITTKCLAPTGVKVTANAKGKPVVSWSKTEGAKKYEVYVATSANGTYKKLTTTSKLTYTYTKAKANTTYYFKITAYGSSTSSRSAYSSTVKF